MSGDRVESWGAAASTLPSFQAQEAPRQALTFPARSTGLGLVYLAWVAGGVLSVTLTSQSLTTISSSLCCISAICALLFCSILPETRDQPLSDCLEDYTPQER